ncbi:hypothetical protein FRC04_011987 [Tulasnella sp. 424]|nr:hypothetical protein FRC04_011987 [Tulasnella sp. 424]KAG8971313.1 hypothetical protein FRC05_011305 [Tulasnella sp. 425]
MAADSLPAELWIQVFAATRQWRKVSKFTIIPLYSNFIEIISTCSKFRDIAIPLLYKHVAIHAGFPSLKIHALQSVLREKPERGRFIKSIVGYWSIPKTHEEMTGAFGRTFGQMNCLEIVMLIPFLPSIESIHLDRPYISKDLLTVICTRTLRTLSIHDAQFEQGLTLSPQHLGTEVEKRSSLLQLRVTVSTPNLTLGSLYFLRIPNLHRITFTDYGLWQTRMSFIFFRGLELPWSQLRELKLTGMIEMAILGGLDELCRILEHAPKLESLVVDVGMSRRQNGGLGWDQSPPPTSVVPKLKEFYGPAVIAPQLCEGKAIEKLGLIFHNEIVDAKPEDVSLNSVAGTLRHLTLGNMETDMVIDLLKPYRLLESLDILPTTPRCQRDTISPESDYIGQPRQDERSQLEHWVRDYLVPLVSALPHLTRLVVRPFEGTGAVIARRGRLTGEYRSRPSPPDPGLAPDPAEPCIDEKDVLEKLLVPCTGLKEVVFPSLHKWTRYHPTYGWELVERQSGKFDTEDYPQPFSREDLRP